MLLLPTQDAATIPATATAAASCRAVSVANDCCLPPLLSSLGHAMMSSETVRKIGFTGSTAVGKLLAEQAAKVGASCCLCWLVDMN